MRPELTFAAAENAPSRSRATMSNASGAKRPRASTRPVASSPAGSRPAQTASPQSGRSSARICRRVVMIGQQRLAYGQTVAVGPPKTAASRRTIALDRHAVRALRTHRRRQGAERRAAGERWQESGYVFTTADGAPLHPDCLSRSPGPRSTSRDWVGPPSAMSSTLAGPRDLASRGRVPRRMSPLADPMSPPLRRS